MSATDSDTSASNGNSLKRTLNQDSSPRKKPRLSDGTSHPLQARKRLQEAANNVLDDIRRPNTYVYTPLEESNGQDIRVLVIEPGKGDDPMKCRLVPSAFPNAKPSDTKAYPYTALSYFWGDGDPIHEVTITSYSTPKKRMKKPSKKALLAYQIRKRKPWCLTGKLYVRSHLYVALQRFRQVKKRTIMWIDALCIDQDDDFERSAQVAQMHKLYTQAHMVNIWLGDGSSAEASPKCCFGFLRKLLDLQNLDSLLGKIANEESNILKKANHVINLMCNKWFSRRWIIQELALARNVKVVYGTQEMPWPDFADAIAIFIKNEERIRPQLSNMFNNTASSVPELALGEVVKNLGANALVDFINNLFRRNENGDVQHRIMTLESLVSTLLAFEAKNPRDTIYAVMSLAKDTPNLSVETNANAAPLQLDERLKPAYQNCLLDVYTDFIDYCIDKSNSLDILLRHWAPSEESERHKTPLSKGQLRNLLAQLEKKTEMLPTWTPLIQKSSYGTPTQRIQGRLNGDSFVGISIRSSQRNYSATLNLKPKKKFGRSPEDTSKGAKKYTGILFVKGLQIGTIKETTPRAAQGMLFKECFDLAGFDSKWWQDRQQWAEDVPRIPEAFWRTIVADRGPDGANPPSWYYRAFCECLNNLRSTGDLRPDDVIGLPNASSLAKSFLERVKDVVWERLFVQTQLDGGKEKLTYGLAPKDTKQGDMVCVLFGCSVPVVLRQQDSGNEKYFHMIGECFVYGMMDGEAVAGKEWRRPYNNAEWFEIR
ncbi:hypothetical protein EG329_000064 [Mollisiaceae sp. DMI_Dod_QoI]|nr:hypothetical protein EG329_000064 [Helotiales sp. DMI_Dod_QoI]